MNTAQANPLSFSLLLRFGARLSRSVRKALPNACACLAFSAALILTASLNTQDKMVAPVGDWVGTLQVQSKELHLALHVTSDKDGGLHASFDSLDQGANGIRTESVRLRQQEFSFDVPVIHGHYEGSLNAESSAISGTWSQGAVSVPLTWKRGQSAQLERPQEPKPPFPYGQEDVWVENTGAAVRLAGTLTKPAGKGPFPAVFLITGSGPQDRDETVFGHKPFLLLADFLTRHGMAVLRVDDRGTAKSSGNFKQATTEDFVSDALSRFLSCAAWRHRPQTDRPDWSQ